MRMKNGAEGAMQDGIYKTAAAKLLKRKGNLGQRAKGKEQRALATSGG